MVFERNILPGTTDYTGVPMEDILEHLKDWLINTDLVIKNISEEREKVKAKDTLFEDSEGILSYCDYFVELFSRYRNDLVRLNKEMPVAVTQSHLEIIHQLYRSSRNEAPSAIEFKTEWISHRLPHNEVRPILDQIYKNARHLFEYFRDLPNLAQRLLTFIKPTGGNVLTNINIKLENSPIGVLNTGTIKSVEKALTILEQSGESKFSASIKNLSEAILNSNVSNDIKFKIMEKVSVLATEGTLPKEKINKSAMRPLIQELAALIQGVSSLSQLWDQYGSVIISFFSGN